MNAQTCIFILPHLVESRPLFIEKQSDRRPFTAKRIVRKFLSSLALSSLFGVMICGFFFLKATFAVDLVFSLYCKLNFENDKKKKNFENAVF